MTPAPIEQAKPAERTTSAVLEQFVGAVLAFLSRGYLVDSRILIQARMAAQLSKN